MTLTSFEIWSYIFGGATVFALIVGIFSVWNGRMTRRELAGVTREEEARTRTMINSMEERSSENIRKMDEHMRQMDERTNENL
ncbi:MAG: hypothetical protein AB1742_10850 [bacterium]